MILILVWSPLTIAQQYSATEDDISDLLDDIVAVPDQEMDYEEFYDNLVHTRSVVSVMP